MNNQNTLTIRDVVRLNGIVQASQTGARVRFLYERDGQDVDIAGVARHIEWNGEDIRDGHLIVNDGVSDVPVLISDAINADDGAFDAGPRAVSPVG
ncbi:hypothetical protein [Gordonia aichiensis]|uniref:hypothetical protein n=1 Tax=Gordonia aichiensis TaxID=36820 RepID=UPI0032673F6A